MYLLDTNHCSNIIFGNEAICKKLSIVGESLINTNTIVAGELIFMAQKSDKKERNLAKVYSFLADINLYSLNEDTADIYGSLKAKIINYFGPKEKAKRRKITINELGVSDNDLWIAATAIQENLIVVSKDRDFLRIKQVQEFNLESWIVG